MIIPAIIPKTFADIEHDVSLVKDVVSRVQIDVMDGVYSPEASWPYSGADAEIFHALAHEERGLPHWELVSYEIDMLVVEPESKIDDWITMGAETLIIHIESTTKLKDIVERAVERGVDVALALKPSTNIEQLAPWIERISFVQCMGNDKIGYHGVSFDERVLNKIREIKACWSNLVVGIDIGVSVETVPALAEAGVTRFASGSAILNAKDPRVAVAELRRAAGEKE